MTVDEVLPDAEATEAAGARLADALAPGDVLLLEGPLGAGKTTLVRGVVAGLGGDPAEVCSPTFVLLESYRVARGGLARLHHADLYRLAGRPQAPWRELGLDEALDDPAAIVAVEWPAGWSWEARAWGRLLRLTLTLLPEGRHLRVHLAHHA